MLKNWILKHERASQRILEILPGFVSLNIILFPYWGILVIPEVVAYFVLLFNIFWFYQSFQIAVGGIISHFKMQAYMHFDWVGDLKAFPDWQKVRHVVIIPTYKEPLHILIRTLNALGDQTLPAKQLIPILAMEKKEPDEERNAKIAAIKEKFSEKLPNLTFTVHTLLPGEAAGKASNEKYAAVWYKKNVIDKNGEDLNYYTVTSCDADHKFHPQHFAALTFKFLDNPKRYNRFWQGAVMFYNNIWEIPAISRVPNTLASIWDLSQLPRKDRLINAQNYSLSFKLLHEAGYWDASKIPEDWNIFFTAFFHTKGEVEVEPLYLPIHADAAQSTTIWKTIKNQYEQYKRWAWGVSDDPWIIKQYLTIEGIPFWNKTTRLFFVIWAHFFWPVNWFIVTIGLTLPVLFNPAFGRTSLGFMVPKVSSFILTLALLFLAILIVMDYIYKPKKPKGYPTWKAILSPLEFILMPVVGFFFTALPGLDAHTRLMLGKYLEYKVTEKV